MSQIHKHLSQIQSMLKAPKNQFNSFGNYKYRSCEDILEAVKPLLTERGLILKMSDRIEAVGDRVFVVSTVGISDGSGSTEVQAAAREPLARKGMDDSQLTGAASSYARKYALNGLFAIDDARDADHQLPGQQRQQQPQQQVQPSRQQTPPPPQQKPPMTEPQRETMNALLTYYTCQQTESYTLDRNKLADAVFNAMGGRWPENTQHAVWIKNNLNTLDVMVKK